MKPQKKIQNEATTESVNAVIKVLNNNELERIIIERPSQPTKDNINELVKEL